jgi:hypothetical protein
MTKLTFKALSEAVPEAFQTMFTKKDLKEFMNTKLAGMTLEEATTFTKEYIAKVQAETQAWMDSSDDLF